MNIRRVWQCVVLDAVRMGEKFLEWALEPSTRSATCDMWELRDQLIGIADIPPEVSRCKFAENSVITLTIRLRVPSMAWEATAIG